MSFLPRITRNEAEYAQSTAKARAQRKWRHLPANLNLQERFDAAVLFQEQLEKCPTDAYTRDGLSKHHYYEIKKNHGIVPAAAPVRKPPTFNEEDKKMLTAQIKEKQRNQDAVIPGSYG